MLDMGGLCIAARESVFSCLRLLGKELDRGYYAWDSWDWEFSLVGYAQVMDLDCFRKWETSAKEV